MRYIGETKYKVDEVGNVYGILNGKKLKPAVDCKGYLRVALRVDGKLTTKKVHRLVAGAYIDNVDNKPQVNHKNGVKTDNNVSNLEWCTNKENQIHAVRSGLCGYVKLSVKEVLEIRALYKTKEYTQKEIGEMYGVIRQHVSDIVNYKRWAHV